jgi:hypothetical protein
VDEKPAPVVPVPILNPGRNEMSNRALIAVFTIGALAAVGLMDAGSGGNSSTGDASETVITFAVKAAGMDDHAFAIPPAYVTGKTSANPDTHCNFSPASVTTPYDLTVVDAANKRALISQGLSRLGHARTRFGLTSTTTPRGTKIGKTTGLRTTAAPADGIAEPTGFHNPTIINYAGGSVC